MEMIWQFMMQTQQQQNVLMQQQREQILLMQRLLGNNTDNDSSSNEYNCMNVDSDSGTDIGYETDMTEDNADMDVTEDSDGDEDHDISDFAKLFADNEHSLECLTRFPSDQVALLPQVIDNDVDGARTGMTTMDDAKGDSTSIPSASLPPTKFPMTKVDNTDNKSEIEKGYKLAAVMGRWRP
jgi:hypothetical protein